MWKVLVVLGVVGLLAGLGTCFAINQRAIGAANAALASTKQDADSIEKRLAAAEQRIAAEATVNDSLARAVALHRAADRAAAVETDTAKAHLATARDSALAAAHDSSATTAQLRTDLVRFVAASDSAERAHATERTALNATIATLEADTAAKARAIAARDVKAADLERLNRDVKQEVAILQRRVPSTGGQVTRETLAVALTYAGCRFLVRCAP